MAQQGVLVEPYERLNQKQVKVAEKTLPGQLESHRSWREVLGFVPLSGTEGTRTAQ